MRIQILGTAAYERIPALFCTCTTCRYAREHGGKEIRTQAQTLINEDLLVDFGQERAKPLLNQNVLVDAQGEDIVFNSKIDALNYMDSLGWNFLQAYTSVDGSKGSTSSKIHWLLYKDVVEGENPYAGLTTKQDIKK